MSPTSSTPTSPTSPTPAYDDFAVGLRGTVLRSGDDGFDEARVVLNGRTADTPPP
ncbi:hypothetical protein [Streptomyces blattellae]|uniref:hypothetical protein n=1 Tax=Streptomyces blattellae TaxID=2569855 RepID=UPI0012B97A8A|nr:hypothetical protein [Streptomyces blattellae]